jgi:hypothetical protein
MAFSQGLSRPKDLPAWDDPWVAYGLKRDENAGGAAQRFAIRPREGRDRWRDFAALFLADEGRGRPGRPPTATRPGILRQLDFLMRDGLLSEDAPLRFETFALRTDAKGKAKVFEWQHHRFDFPPVLLKGEAAASVEEALQRAEAVAGCLARSLRLLHPIAERKGADRKAQSAALGALIERTLRGYWLDLELTFRRLICDSRLREDMASQSAWDEEWRLVLRERAERLFEATLEAGGAEMDAEALRRQELARGRFYGTLAATLRGDRPTEGSDAAGGEEGA